MFGHTHRGLGSSVCFHWGFMALSGLSWHRPGLELPKLQINLVIHPGLFGFRAGRLQQQPRAALLGLPWTIDGSTKPLVSPSCQTRGLGSCGGTAGDSLGPHRAGSGCLVAPGVLQSTSAHISVSQRLPSSEKLGKSAEKT